MISIMPTSTPYRRGILRTFSLCLVLSIPWMVIHGYNVMVYTGSHIPTARYTKLVDRMQSILGNESTVSIGKYSPFRRAYPNDTILVGHSFGGTFALWDAHKPNVKGIVLLYSHFNTRHKMWYPGVDMTSIQPPVLTILGTDDERLPFHCAVDDLVVKQEQRVRNKHFVIKVGNRHFSGLPLNDRCLVEDVKINELAEEITHFIQSMDTYDNGVQEQQWGWFQPSSKPRLPHSRDFSQSLGLLDALLKASGMIGWWHAHFLGFLSSKPKPYENVEFTWAESILYKTHGVSLETFQSFVNTQMFPHIDIDWRIIQLPSIHPAILPWLLREPRLIPSHRSSSKRWMGEMIVLPVNENVTYYRIPHRHWLLRNVSMIPSSSLSL